jgi:hypothetical protein
VLALPRRARTYVVLVCAAAVLGLTTAPLISATADFRPVPFALLLVLSVLGNLTQVGAGDRESSVSFSFIVQIAAFALLGPWWAALIAAISSLVHLGKWSLVVRAFNAGQHGLATLVGGAAYGLVGGAHAIASTGSAAGIFTTLVLPMLVGTAVLCVANAALLAGIINAQRRVPYREVFLGTLNPGAATYVGYGMFGLLLAVLWDGAGIGPLSAVLVLAPLYIARWAWAQYAEENKAYERTVRALVGAVEMKDLYTRGHNERVSRASVMIARELTLSAERTEMLRFAGILHDVGKIGVPTRVLQKTGRLTEEEFEAIALHPVRGLDMVRGIEFLQEAYSGILHHHERLDGRGYPMGLQGQEIPEFARIIAVADAFDSMTSTRSYRQARSVEDAIVELRRCAGSQFEPRFVEALIAALDVEHWEPAVAPAVPAADVPPSAPEAFDHDDPQVQAPATRRQLVRAEEGE